MALKKLRLSARVSSENLSGIRPVLKKIVGSKGTVRKSDDGFEIEAVLEGESAKDLNRRLLSEMRRVEKRTRLRAEWTYGTTTEKFFDYVSKGTRTADK